ncbi:hypothetical protein GOC72_18860 [Sinorhizobium medicae]|nr:hypothetical protein [Sinorhizobium medicae]
MKLVIGLLMGLFSTGAIAAEVGRTEIEGRTVILDSDGTWSFLGESSPSVDRADKSQEPAVDCSPVSSKVLPVVVCLPESDWSRAKLGGSFEIGFKANKVALYAGFITERIPMSDDTTRKAIVQQIETAAGLKPVKVLVSDTKTINDHDWVHIVVETMIYDIPITYEFYVTSIEDKGTAQFVFYGPNEQFSETKDLREKAASGLTIGD